MKDSWIYLLVVGAALAIIVYAGVGPAFVIPAVLDGKIAPTATVEGEIMSIEESAKTEPLGKQAVVKLPSGETVRAHVPDACVIFVGQIANLSEYPGGFYVLKYAKEKRS